MHSADDQEDGAIVARCVRGDTAAFAALVERYERVLFSVALRMLGDAEDARDATQDTFTSEEADALRPYYLEYLRRHNVTAP